MPLVSISITTSDANELERTQQKFAALSYKFSLPHGHYSYANALAHLELNTLRKRRHHLDVLLLIQAYICFKYCPSLYAAVGLQVPTRFLRDFSMFSISPAIKNSPTRRAAAAEVVCKYFCMFNTKLFLSVTFCNYVTSYLSGIKST
jgi:hypothetical protein